MIRISKEDKKTVVVWSCIFGFLIAQTLSFIVFLLVPAHWGWEKKKFLLVDLVLTIALCLVIKALVFFGVKFSSSIRINR